MKSPQISDWQTDRNGRRFRRIGDVIEYEPEISVAGISVPVSQAENFRKSLAESEKNFARARAEAEAREYARGLCPLQQNIRCRKNCAFYSEEGCMQSQDSLGKHCPLSNHSCTESCMLYRDGCQIQKRSDDDDEKRFL